MKIFDNLRGRAAIQGTADRFGQSPEEVRQEIQAAIDAAWDTDALTVMKLQRELFPDGKPTPEQFIEAIVNYMRTTPLP